MCGRTLCDIAIVHGTMRLLRVSMTVGIPRRPGAPAADRKPRLLGAPLGQKPRDPRVAVYVSEAEDRWRICHGKKRDGRGHLDRTVTAARLEGLYAAALAGGQNEVVLR
jgi:hypothetical protein